MTNVINESHSKEGDVTIAGAEKVSSSTKKDVISNKIGKMTKKLSFKLSLTKKKKKTIVVVASFVAVFALVHVVLFFDIFTRGKAFELQARVLMSKVNDQNLPEIKKELANTSVKLEKLRKSYGRIAWMKYYPFVGSFVSDGQHGLNAAVESFAVAEIVVRVFEPYADTIGFWENPTEGSSDTTQDRIDFVVKTIPEIIPRLGEIAGHAEVIQKELSNIDPGRYPESFAGKEIRSNLTQGLEVVDTMTDFAKNGQSILEQAPYLLGADEERNYIILFQNNKELRPTGGFITAYTEAKVKNGKFEPGVSNDIYNLDNLYTPQVPAPDPIVKYLKGPYLISENYRLRDMNWSPDFSESMKLFLEEIKQLGNLIN